MKTVLFFVLAFWSSFLCAQMVTSKSPHSSFSGDEYYFSVFVNDSDQYAYRVYLELEDPIGKTTLYQLDPVRHRKQKEFLWYSCVLCLADVGLYSPLYYVVDRSGKRLDCKEVGDFEVYHTALETLNFFNTSKFKILIRLCIN